MKLERKKLEKSTTQNREGNWETNKPYSGPWKRKDIRPAAVTLSKTWGDQSGIDLLYLNRGRSITLHDYLAGWLANHRFSLRDKTAYQYSRLIENHILPRLGNAKLKELRLIDIEGFYKHLIDNGVGTRTVRIINNLLHAAFEKAVKYGLIIRNPTQGATLPIYRHDEMRVLNPDQINCFLKRASCSPNFALYYLAITTGMRLGELLGLKWSDVDWSIGVIHVNRQKQDVPGKGPFLVEPKTKSGRRSIVLGKGSREILEHHKESQVARKEKLRDRWTDMDLIFPNSVGKLGDYSNIRSDFNKILAEAEIPRIRFHDLRHTAASILLNHNVPVIVVSQILGHTRPSVTLDIYAHVFTTMQGEAAEVMDRVVGTFPHLPPPSYAS